MSQLPKAGISSPSDDRDDDNDIPTYCVLGQELTVCTFDDDHFAALAMPEPKDLLTNQQTDTYCQHMSKLVNGSESRFTIDDDGLICQKAPLHGSLQAIVLESFRRAILYNGHHPIYARNSGTKRMYDNLGRQVYWPYMSPDVFDYVEICDFCCKYRPSQKHQRWTQLLPTSILLKFVAKDILAA